MLLCSPGAPKLRALLTRRSLCTASALHTIKYGTGAPALWIARAKILTGDVEILATRHNPGGGAAAERFVSSLQLFRGKVVDTTVLRCLRTALSIARCLCLGLGVDDCL
jgi:hypothetical protein